MEFKRSIIYEIKQDGLYDGYGTCMSWLFAIADYITSTLGEDTPEAWEFSQSIMGADEESQEFKVLMELQPTLEQLLPIAAILWRYKSMLTSANKDY